MTKTLDQLMAMRDVTGKFDWPNVVASLQDLTVSSSNTPLNRIPHVDMRPSGMQIMDIVRLEISRKRARLSTRLEELFAGTFIVSSEEVAVTIKRRHAGVHGHLHYDLCHSRG